MKVEDGRNEGKIREKYEEERESKRKGEGREREVLYSRRKCFGSSPYRDLITLRVDYIYISSICGSQNTDLK